jgi:hypothetical protein
LYFNFVPHISVSPSHNVLNICERALSNDFLNRNILGVSFKLDKLRHTLYNHGSFILREFGVATDTIGRLRELGISSSYATFSSFLLTNSQVESVRSLNDNSLVVNDYLLRNNVLANNSNVDFDIPVPFNYNNNLADIVYPIVQEVLRSLDRNSYRHGQPFWSNSNRQQRGANRNRGIRGSYANRASRGSRVNSRSSNNRSRDEHRNNRGNFSRGGRRF